MKEFRPILSIITQKKHQGIGMNPNEAYFKSLKQNAAKYSAKH
jgi:hypothetical protein